MLLGLQFVIYMYSCNSFFFCVCLYLIFFFFFSSRRRHTRFDCDWSSDVCSSDLLTKCMASMWKNWCDCGRAIKTSLRSTERMSWKLQDRGGRGWTEHDSTRSEERRVGKEWRSRWAPYH